MQPDTALAQRPGRPLRVATALQVMVAAGNGLAYVALSLRVYQETHSTLAVTMVLLAGGLPVVLLAPLSGLLLDRLPMGRLLTGAALLVAAALTGLAFAHSLTATVLLVFGFGVADSILAAGPDRGDPAAGRRFLVGARHQSAAGRHHGRHGDRAAPGRRRRQHRWHETALLLGAAISVALQHRHLDARPAADPGAGAARGR